MNDFALSLLPFSFSLSAIARRCRRCPGNFVIVLLVDGVDEVDGQDDADVLGFPTVLDVQGDVEVILCDLLYEVL